MACPIGLPIIRTLPITFRAHLDNARFISCLEILNFITSVKSVSPFEVTFVGFRLWTLWGGGIIHLTTP